jgi:hypothetical protein
MRQVAVIILTALTASCSKPGPEAPQSVPSPFQAFAERLGGEPPCSKVIPQEWAPSFPVPVLHNGLLHYRTFFSGWQGRPDTGIRLREAEGDALFGTDGRVLECAPRAKAGANFLDEPAKGSAAEHATRVRALYDMIEETGRLYAKGLPVAGAERVRLARFAAEFAALSPRGHSSSYHALNPEFWMWVEKNSVN